MPPTLAKALAVLAANEKAEQGSLLYALHERDVFDERAFWALYDAMAVIADTPPDSRDDDTRRLAARVHQEILLHVIYHLNPRDSARVEGFPAENLYDWLNRLEWVFNPVVYGVDGYGPGQFDDRLVPPAAGRMQH